MSKRVEKLLKDYPQMVQERNCLAYQIAHFKGLSTEEVIESMYTPRQDGERVQTSILSDKTAQIAMNYRERTERINREWYAHLANELYILEGKLQLLEAAINALSGVLPDLMRDMVVDQMTWEQLAEKYHMSRATVGRQRQKAIQEMEALYEENEKKVIAYMLD